MSVINTNVTALIAQNNLAKSQDSLSQAQERLSSGLRINSAKDDAAGQAIANRFSSQINGLDQAARNANDGISIAQTAEGALGQINDNVQRIRDLVVQAGNSTNSGDDLQSIQDEINQRVDEIDRVSNQTDFNGTTVLGGAGTGGTTSITIQVGANDGESIDISIDQVSASALGAGGADGTAGGLNALDVTDTATGGGEGFNFGVNGDALALVDQALQSIDSTRSNLGAAQNRFESAITNLETNQTNLTDARSRIEDADFAEEVSNQVKAQILQQAGTSVLAQANQTPQNVLSLLG